jgi:DNA-binding response OmpR family regulator
MITEQVENPAVVPLRLAAKKDRLQAAGKPQLELSKRFPTPKRILIIDDEAMIADSLAEILNNRGYEAQAFYDGREAIDEARKQCPDFVLSDVVMPRLSGVETVLAIRRICPGARILLFSGQASTTDILDARARVHDFELLPKPIHPDKLLRKLTILGRTS